MRVFESASQLPAAVGQTVGHSAWLAITQEMIDRFADLTGDRQWIHVDVERARREMPQGRTIAHGFLLVSLIGTLMPQICKVQCRATLNLGADRLRFVSPVPSGARVRLSVMLKDCQPANTPGVWRVTWTATLEVEGAAKPGFVADIVLQYAD